MNSKEDGRIFLVAIHILPVLSLSGFTIALAVDYQRRKTAKRSFQRKREDNEADIGQSTGKTEITSNYKN